MGILLDRLAYGQFILGSSLSVNTKTGLALGSVYTYNSTGAAIGVKFIAPVSGNLTNAYFFVTATAGIPGLTTVELRDYNTSQNTRPGTTLHATQTVSPGTTANKWINCAFGTPFSVVQGTVYWIVIGDAGWTTGNTATVDYIARMSGGRTLNQTFASFTTSDGFSTNGTNSNAVPALVLKFADGSVFGNPFTTDAAYTSNQLERGIKITGLTEKMIVSGVAHIGTSGNISGLKIYSGNTAPGGTADLTVTFASTGNGLTGAAYFAPFTLQRNRIYRIVLTCSGNTTTPSYLSIEDAAGNTDITNCGFGQGTMYDTIDNGAGGWTDNIDRFPEMMLICQDQLAIHGGSPMRGLMG